MSRAINITRSPRSGHPAITIPALAAATLSLGLTLTARPAAAQMAHIPQNDWRQPDRHDVLLAQSSKPAFAFEVRLGPYLPNVDGEFNGGKSPFTDVFGTDCDTPVSTTSKPSVKQRVYFGLEFDALPLRIPYVGMFGLGVGWGYTQFSNRALFSDKSKAAKAGSLPNCSQETTSLMIMPMHASLVLRVDELMRRTGIPIVPYGKAGVGFSFWRASTDAGTEHCSSTSSNAAAAAACTTDHSGMGWSPSLHFALGGMLALNFIDPRASARLDETTGVHHAYLFGEWYSDTISLSSKTLRVGASSWVAGLAVDL
jgi:hypothetical protein